jgi:ACR3 family arsenite efflux pump ArsB
MERLTVDRGERTWKLYHLSWYINILLVILVLAFALHFYVDMLVGASSPNDATRDAIMMSIMLFVAIVLLLGAGISRYQARLEGQHLEIKLAIKELSDRIDSLEK